MNLGLRAFYRRSALIGVAFLVLGSNATADECASNPESDPPMRSASIPYNSLPILIWLHNSGSGSEQPKISTICYGKHPYSAGTTNPGDMYVDANSASVRFRLGQDLQITKWRPKSRSRKAHRPQPGISMNFTAGEHPARTPPDDTEWVDCGTDVTASESDISFDFSKCLAHFGTYQYALHLRKCQGNKCKDIRIDPRIINQPKLP